MTQKLLSKGTKSTCMTPTIYHDSNFIISSINTQSTSDAIPGTDSKQNHYETWLLTPNFRDQGPRFRSVSLVKCQINKGLWFNACLAPTLFYVYAYVYVEGVLWKWKGQAQFSLGICIDNFVQRLVCTWCGSCGSVWRRPEKGNLSVALGL